MINKKQLQAAWALHYSTKNPFAVTFVFNKDIRRSSSIDKLKLFQRIIDEERLGRNFYCKPASSRLDFLVAPERFDAGNPHYHGIMAMPCEGRTRLTADQMELRIQEVWSFAAPAGSLDLTRMHDPEGWLSYCSKENSLTTSDQAIWSLADFVPHRA